MLRDYYYYIFQGFLVELTNVMFHYIMKPENKIRFLIFESLSVTLVPTYNNWTSIKKFAFFISRSNLGNSL